MLDCSYLEMLKSWDILKKIKNKKTRAQMKWENYNYVFRT